MQDNSRIQGSFGTAVWSTATMVFRGLRKRPRPWLMIALIGAGFLAGSLWTSVAADRFTAQCTDFAVSHPSFFTSHDLNFSKSYRPFLKRPWRSDVRLFFGSAFAHRNDSGPWHIKSCQ